MKRMFGRGEGPRDPREIDDDVLDSMPADLGRSAAIRRKPQAGAPPATRTPGRGAPPGKPGARPAPRQTAAAPRPAAVAAKEAHAGPDPWRELEVEFSRRIVEKSPPKTSVGTRLLEKVRSSQAIARQEVQDLREISRKLDQKILESGLHVLPTVEGNVNAVLGIDVDEADLPRDAEQLLILSVRLMRAAKNFTLSKKLREAVFCYEKAAVLFDKVLDLDPSRDNTREMKKLVDRFIKILGKRI